VTADLHWPLYEPLRQGLTTLLKDNAAQIAVTSELPNERVNLAQRERDREPSLEVAAKESIRRHAEVECRFRRLLDDGGPMFLGEREHAEDPADAGGAVVLMDRVTDPADVRAGGLGARQQGQDGTRGASGPIVVLDLVPSARRPQMLAEQLAGLRREQLHVRVSPLHVDPVPDPAGGRAVVGGVDFDAAVEMDRALAVAVIAKRLNREYPQSGLLFGKHRGHLPLGRPMDACVGPVGFPAIQVGLRLVETFEPQAAQRRLLRMPDPGFDFPFAIRISDPTRERDDAVVCEHVAIERIERGVVDVGG
jgi:hypothetical protein